jgi:hypothetical protein
MENPAKTPRTKQTGLQGVAGGIIDNKDMKSTLSTSSVFILPTVHCLSARLLDKVQIEKIRIKLWQFPPFRSSEFLLVVMI